MEIYIIYFRKCTNLLKKKKIKTIKASINNDKIKLPIAVSMKAKKVSLLMLKKEAMINPTAAKNKVPSWHKTMLDKNAIELSLIVSLFSIV